MFSAEKGSQHVQCICIILFIHLSGVLFISNYCFNSDECQSISDPSCINGVCSPCDNDADCGKFMPGGTCNTAMTPHQCALPCDSEDLCYFRKASRCNLDTKLCEKCLTDADCEHLLAYPTCYNGICGNCASNSDCLSGLQCSRNKCSLCDVSGAGCSTNKARCIEYEQGMNRCDVCYNSTNCRWDEYPFCNTSSGSCTKLRCIGDSDCDPTRTDRKSVM